MLGTYVKVIASQLNLSAVIENSIVSHSISSLALTIFKKKTNSWVPKSSSLDKLNSNSRF